MFQSRTVFIVGAGASCEAGLPSGEALKNKIATLLDIRFPDGYHQQSGDTQITQTLREYVRLPSGHDGDINAYLRKAWRIRDVVPSAAISIDNFLDAHRGDEAMALCGKLGIVKAILQAEHDSLLKKIEPHEDYPELYHVDQFDLRKLTGSWYLSFFQMLTENVAKGDADTVFDNVSIITFNYDRCIERFLPQALSQYYELSFDDAIAIAKRLQIFHPYGTVGPLSWQDQNGQVPFGGYGRPLLPMASRIKTFTEGLDDETILGPMHDAIIAAETVVFLGFAFHPLNMKLLTPNRPRRRRGGRAALELSLPVRIPRIFATTLGLSTADVSVIEDDIYRMLGADDLDLLDTQKSKPEFANMKGGDFFKHYFRSLSAG